MFKKPYTYAIGAFVIVTTTRLTHQPLWVQTLASTTLLTTGVICLIHALRNKE